MKRIFLIGTALLLCSAAALAQYTNILEDGTNVTVTSAWTNDTVSVGQNTPSNTLSIVDGGMVFSTNVFVGETGTSSNNAASVTGTGSWMIEETLTIGVGTSNVVSVGGGGTLSVGNLTINSGNELNLDSGGTFVITTNFNASTDGFNWYSGGELSVGGELTGMDTTNLVVGGTTNPAYYLAGGRDLTLDGGSWDISGTNLVVGYDGSGSDLVVQNTGSLSSATTYIGWDTDSTNSAITLSGGSTWTNSEDLWVGYGAGGSEFSIVNAGTNILDGNAYIGNTNTANNQVLVSGTNSLWSVGGNLEIGNGSNSVNNSLSVSTGGRVDVVSNVTVNAGNTLSVDSGGEIRIEGGVNIYSNTVLAGTGSLLFGITDSLLEFNGAGITISTNLVFDGGLGDNSILVNGGNFANAAGTALQYTNFQTLVLIDSTLNGFGTIGAFDSISMIGGVIDPSGVDSDTAQLIIPGDFVAAGTTNRAQVYDTRNDELVFTGTNPIDLSTMAIDVEVVDAPAGTATVMRATNTTLDGEFYETNLVDRLLLYNAVLQKTDTEVQISLEGDTLESSMEFAATEMIRAGFNGMKNSVFTRTKQLRRNLVATSQSIPNEVFLLTTTNAPAGAMGPGDQNTIFDMHVWLQHSSGRGDFDSQGASDGFALNNQSTTIGADRLVGEAMTLGFNYTHARSSARTSGMDDLDGETYWLGAYGEWVGKEGLYVDALVGYGLSNYDTERREEGDGEDYQGTASYEGRAFGGYADVGQYYHSGNLALSPYAGIHVLTIVTDGHTETEAKGSSVYVDEVSRNLVESALGLKMRHRFDTRIGRFQSTGYAEWAHDFIQDDVSAMMTQAGFPAVSTGIISPDADTVNAGLGFSWISTDYLEVGIGYNGRYSENYEEHAGTLMLDIMF